MSDSPYLKKKELVRSVTEAVHTKSPGFELTARDYEILRFILEQKFCSLEAIFFRFFDARKLPEDPLPKNFWTTRQRLSKLRSSCLIKTEKVLSSGRAHYLITPLGHKILSGKSKDILSIQSPKAIDFSLYEHDVRITMVRAFTEVRGKCEKWFSEKWLKAQPIYIDGKYKYNFSKDLRPDAVFINSKKEKMAFELEVARKSRSRLEEKIRLYDALLEEQSRLNREDGEYEHFKVLDKVWFVTTKPQLARYLRIVIENTTRHPLCYRVDLYDEVIPAEARRE